MGFASAIVRARVYDAGERVRCVSGMGRVSSQQVRTFQKWRDRDSLCYEARDGQQAKDDRCWRRVPFDMADNGSRYWPGLAGEMAERIRAHDWASTPLGPIENWPPSLKTVVDLMLCGLQAAYIAFGPELTSLYNDGYIPILGTKHPDSLGQPYSEIWPEIWSEVQPLIEATMAGDTQHFVDLTQEQVWSPESYELHGRDPRLGKPSYDDWLNCLHPDDRAKVERIFQKSVAKKFPEYRTEYRVVLPSGEVRWLDALAKVD